jgi:hypothetical protein
MWPFPRGKGNNNHYIMTNERPSSESGNKNLSKDTSASAVPESSKPLSWIGRIDPQIWVAVIGIIGTFIASPLAVQMYNQLQLPAISDQRRQTLEGRWEGTGTQILSKDDRKKLETENQLKIFPAHLSLSVNGRTINGTLDITSLRYDNKLKSKTVNANDSPDPIVIEHKEISYNLSGNMVANNYLRLDYVSRDPAVIEFGSLLLRLPSTGGKLEGKYISFGPLTERLVSGEYVFSQSR